MTGLDGLQDAGTGPRLGMPGFQDARVPRRHPQTSLPGLSLPELVGSISRSPVLVRILGAA